MADMRRIVLIAAAGAFLAAAAPALSAGQGNDALSGPDRQPWPEPTPSRPPSKPVKPRRKKHRKGSRK